MSLYIDKCLHEKNRKEKKKCFRKRKIKKNERKNRRGPKKKLVRRTERHKKIRKEKKTIESGRNFLILPLISCVSS